MAALCARTGMENSKKGPTPIACPASRHGWGFLAVHTAGTVFEQYLNESTIAVVHEDNRQYRNSITICHEAKGQLPRSKRPVATKCEVDTTLARSVRTIAGTVSEGFLAGQRRTSENSVAERLAVEFTDIAKHGRARTGKRWSRSHYFVSSPAYESASRVGSGSLYPALYSDTISAAVSALTRWPGLT